MSKRTLPISAELVVSELQREVVIEKQSIDDDDLSPSQGCFFSAELEQQAKQPWSLWRRLSDQEI